MKTQNPHAEYKQGRRKKPGGVALIAVLAVLTVLALCAAAFVILTTLERTTSEANMAKVQADMLAKSGLEHALSQLEEDTQDQPAWDDYNEEWHTCFNQDTSGEEVDVDGLPGGTEDARWKYVRNGDGSIAGRYAVLIEDETGKININSAAALSDSMQNEGVGTFEILLTDGKERGLPISKEFGQNLLRYRYGRDFRPGQANEDDNCTISQYLSDEIDNDADGKVDEPSEGIDEPDEYNESKLAWDDRSFMSVNEAVRLCSPKEGLSAKHARLLARYATVHSSNADTYWDDREGTWQKQVSLNIATKNQIGTLMRRANEETRFEAQSSNLRNLICNVIDYRDENHVLSTYSSEYGVEAVCFNEVMANEGSYSCEPEWNDPQYADEHWHVHRFGWWYHLSGIWYAPYFENAQFSWKVTSVKPSGGGTSLQNGKRASSPQGATVRLSDDMRKAPAYNNAYSRFKKILKENGGWTPEQWKNAWLVVSRTGSVKSNPYKGIRYPIIGNTKDTLHVGCDPMGENTYELLTAIAGQSSFSNAVWIDNLWRHGATVKCLFPEMTEYFVAPVNTFSEITPPPNLYYYVYTSEQAFRGNMAWGYDYPLAGKSIPWKGYNRYLDTDGDPRQNSRQEIEHLTRQDLRGSTLEFPAEEDQIDLLRFAYKGGEPVRAKNNQIHVLLTTPNDCGYAGGISAVGDREAYDKKTVATTFYMMRPDVVELINISDEPISLRNWRVVINTGSYADQLGLIDKAVSYSPKLRRRYEDPNPVIPAGGYFYLTNKRAVFDYEYGGKKDGIWGNSAEEQTPCYELLDAVWGIRFEVTKVTLNRLFLKGANWRDDQMKFEIGEIYTTRRPNDRNIPTGVRRIITASGRNYIETTHGSWIDDGPRKDIVVPGDQVLILGMPREGGFLSMTLKNEYNQIAARTIEYGSTEPEELTYSTEKLDPTHYTWVKSSKPTFGGMPEQAKNHSYTQASLIPPHVKNNRLASVGELQKVRKAEDWENIGMERKGQPSTKTLKALAKYFTVSGIRLEAEEEGAHLSGWNSSQGTVQQSGAGQCTVADVMWEPGIWSGQKVRVMTGDQKGEIYGISGNTENSISIEGYSCPGNKQFGVRRGDTLAVGPAYSTGMYYTRKNGDPGEWEWKKKGLGRSTYGLYICGLNDSIKTTEFLEENNNAELTIEAYNFETRKYDTIPNPDTLEKKGLELRDIYRPENVTGRHRYDKSDTIFCGLIYPCHISPEEGIRLRLTSHSLENMDSSGFAWFDFAYLAPGRSSGKININTAQPRVLRALQGVDASLAAAIEKGINNDGLTRLKPYKNASDILDVRGMTPDIFTRISNLITARSDQYRVRVIAETLRDTNADGRFTPDTGETVAGRAEINALIDRSCLTDDDSGTSGFTVRYIQ